MKISPPDYSNYFKPDSGHKHTAAPGDAPKLDTTGLVFDPATQAELDAKLDGVTGHKHTGVAGDSAKIGVAGLDFDPATQAELDAKFDAATGHKHTGGAGDAPDIIALQVGNVGIGLAMTERNYASDAAYVKRKEIVVNMNGALRVGFSMRTVDAAYICYGRVYRNDVAIGIERSTTSTTYVSFSEDITGWAPGDLVQLYTYANPTSGYYIKDFNISVVKAQSARTTLD